VAKRLTMKSKINLIRVKQKLDQFNDLDLLHPDHFYNLFSSQS
jgi:predicted transcriptional regulator